MTQKEIITDELPSLPRGEHYTRITFSRRDCSHEYESPRRVARQYAESAGLRVVRTAEEGATIAVYAVEPQINDARGWDRYRNLQCTSAQRVE